jgi:acyl carrier protein
MSATETRTTIDREVHALLARKGRSDRTVRDSDHLLRDVGFDSLDVAELVTRLELALGVDPFAEGATARDYGEFVAVYRDAVRDRRG